MHTAGARPEGVWQRPERAGGKSHFHHLLIHKEKTTTSSTNTPRRLSIELPAVVAVSIGWMYLTHFVIWWLRWMKLEGMTPSNSCYLSPRLWEECWTTPVNRSMTCLTLTASRVWWRTPRWVIRKTAGRSKQWNLVAITVKFFWLLSLFWPFSRSSVSPWLVYPRTARSATWLRLVTAWARPPKPFVASLKPPGRCCMPRHFSQIPNDPFSGSGSSLWLTLLTVDIFHQASYLVGVSDPNSQAGHQGLVDPIQFAKANQAIQMACQNLVDPESSPSQVSVHIIFLIVHTPNSCLKCLLQQVYE